MKLTRRRRKTILYLICAVVFVILCVVFGMQIVNLNHRNKELEKRKIRLEQLLEEQQKRAESLEDEEVYTKTKKFIEEKAKAIGYIYPDEIIFKKQK